MQKASEQQSQQSEQSQHDANQELMKHHKSQSFGQHQQLVHETFQNQHEGRQVNPAMSVITSVDPGFTPNKTPQGSNGKNDSDIEKGWTFNKENDLMQKLQDDGGQDQLPLESNKGSKMSRNRDILQIDQSQVANDPEIQSIFEKAQADIQLLDQEQRKTLVEQSILNLALSRVNEQKSKETLEENVQYVSDLFYRIKQYEHEHEKKMEVENLTNEIQKLQQEVDAKTASIKNLTAENEQLQ